MNTQLQEVINLVKRAGEKVLEIYQKDPKVYQKEDRSVVTEADLASERVILSGLKKYGYGFLSEESEDDRSRLRKERIWIIDPLDGTQDFLQKTGEFSIMVGLVDSKEPIMGVVYQPVGDRMYFAEKGKGAYVKKSDRPLRKLQVSRVTHLPEAHFVVSRSHLSDEEIRFLASTNIGKVSRIGSIGVKLGLIAEGKAEGYVNMSDKTCQWDICAPEIILREAGGQVTDLKDQYFVYNRQEIRNPNGIAASNKAIHHEIIQKLQQTIEGDVKDGS